MFDEPTVHLKLKFKGKLSAFCKKILRFYCQRALSRQGAEPQPMLKCSRSAALPNLAKRTWFLVNF
jgi:hypothetical protein